MKKLSLSAAVSCLIFEFDNLLELLFLDFGYDPFLAMLGE